MGGKAALGAAGLGHDVFIVMAEGVDEVIVVAVLAAGAGVGGVTLLGAGGSNGFAGSVIVAQGIQVMILREAADGADPLLGAGLRAGGGLGHSPVAEAVLLAEVLVLRIGGEPGGAFAGGIEGDLLLTAGVAAEQMGLVVVADGACVVLQIGDLDAGSLIAQGPLGGGLAASFGGHQGVGVAGQGQVDVVLLHLQRIGAFAGGLEAVDVLVGDVIEDVVLQRAANLLQIMRSAAAADAGAGDLAGGVQDLRDGIVMVNDDVVSGPGGRRLGHQGEIALGDAVGGDKVLIQGIVGGVGLGDGQGLAGLVEDGHLLAVLVQSGFGPAQEAVVIGVGSRIARGLREADDVVDVAVEVLHAHAFGHNKVDGGGDAGGKVDPDLAVGLGLDLEDVAVLGHGAGAAEDLVARDLIAHGGRRGDLTAGDGNGAPGVVVGAGCNVELGEQGPQRVRDLDHVHVPVAEIGILRGGDDGESNMVGNRLAVGIAAVGGIPVAVGLGLHVGAGFRHGVVLAHVGPEEAFELVVAGEGDGLGVAVHDLSAAVVEGGFQTVGSHTEADSHPDQAVGGGAVHVVGDGGAVHSPVAAAKAEGMIVGAKFALGGGLVRRGNAGAGGQAEVGGVGLGGVVIPSVIVGGSVGVEDHDAAGIQGNAQVVDVGVALLVGGAHAAGGLGDGVAAGLILGGKAAVDADVGLEGGHVDGSGRAALDAVVHDLRRAAEDSAGDGADLPLGTVAGRVTVGIAVGIKPEEKGAVAFNGPGYKARIIFHNLLDRVGRFLIGGNPGFQGISPAESGHLFFKFRNFCPYVFGLPFRGAGNRQHGNQKQDTENESD